MVSWKSTKSALRWLKGKCHEGCWREAHTRLQKRGGVGELQSPSSQWGLHGLPRVRQRPTQHSGMRYNGRMPREAISTEAGRPKAGSRDGPAMPASKAWGTSWASLGPGPSPDRVVGVDRPELTPLEKMKVFAEGGSPPL